jgi:hypothetical protein
MYNIGCLSLSAPCSGQTKCTILVVCVSLLRAQVKLNVQYWLFVFLYNANNITVYGRVVKEMYQSGASCKQITLLSMDE